MKRDDWTVPYTGAALLTAAKEKAQFHEGRMMWWKQKKADLMEQIKAEGIVISESVVDELGKLGYHTMANSGGRAGPDVTLDPKMVSQLRESAGKVAEHETKISGYKAWVQMLESHQAANFDLDNDDWMYFFGK